MLDKQAIYLSRGQLKRLNILKHEDYNKITDWAYADEIDELIQKLEINNSILMLVESLDKLSVNQYYRYKGYFTVSEPISSSKEREDPKKLVTITSDYLDYTIILGCSMGSFYEQNTVTSMFLGYRGRVFLDTIFLVLNKDGERIIGNPFSIVLDTSQTFW